MESATPRIAFDPALPIAAHADEIIAALRTDRVVVIAGETGSGKTTQLPKMCLAAGRSAIAHTQPRRIAARSVATRLAEELDTPLGEFVGYQVRFHRAASRRTRVKVMTDGVLLAEIAHDRDLRAYDTIIVDEAHERSLNIDFLLGYLTQLLRRRDDLTVVITSATIDTERFSRHFGDAPIITVSGRTYPVEVRYRPLADGDGEPDQVDGICRAVTELRAEGPGDVLVFCSGEREIRDATEGLAGLDLRDTEILPLYARLSLAEQNRVFAPHTGTRIVLATNVAETSLTVPGIRYVVDPGTARISRYSPRSKVQRLPIEPVSQASANQRAGRCGRVAPGVCIRLYSEEDFSSRAEFTDPEIVRTNLAAVILQMAQSDLGDIATFPFLDPPVGTQITDGVRLLRELGALAPSAQRTGRGSPVLTTVGRRLAALPVDPRLGRMILAAAELGCLREVLPIAAGLAIPDVRERPSAARDQADAAHRRFWAPLGADEGAAPDNSDVSALLRLWQYVRRQWRELSGSAFRRMCRAEFLSYLRIREWQDLHAQLKQSCRDLHLDRNEQAADPAAVHEAVLAGLLSHVGLRDDRQAGAQPARRRRPIAEYQGARGTRFSINPGSSAARVAPALVMAVELVETTRLWARTVAPIEPEWVERAGAHLVHRRYAEPHWSKRMGNVMATETVTLYGVPIVAGRSVVYGRIDPVVARELFIRAALVDGEWGTRHQFFHRNEALRRQAAVWEERTRRRDVVVSDEEIFAFYDARIPAGIYSVAHFDAWWRQQRRADEHMLDLLPDDVVATEVDEDGYPDVWTVGEADLPVSYVFDPGAGTDGVSVEIDLARLNQMTPEAFSWQVPGMRAELATELIRSLPKALRTRFVPAPDTARSALEWLAGHPGPPGESLPAGLARALRQLTGVAVPASAWAPERVPAHLQVKYRVLDGDTEVATGTDLAELRERLAADATKVLTSRSRDLSVTGRRHWDFGPVPETVSLGESLVGYPALVDEGGAVGVAVFDTAARQRASHEAGVRRLALLELPDATKGVVGRLSNAVKLGLGDSPYPAVPSLLADCRLKAVGDLLAEHRDVQGIRDEAAFDAVRRAIAPTVPARMVAVVTRTAEVLAAVRAVRTELAGLRAGDTVADASEQLANLVYPGFVAATPAPYDARLPRYLEALRRRLVAARSHAAREAQRLDDILVVEDAYAALCAAQPAGPLPAEVARVGWQIEELRVSLFAQALGTAEPVSVKRVLRAIAAVEAAQP
ncbi:ATP-dependent RNA helicase HrpA [Propionicicella superfundia]|uniref:ATP-dependent RNA helicase HrpA n=1 Tax=Propionicicella superfundia TaxID=348582 RepID=UPI000413216F|nr:ATP-dependent RNA helicase HrpA [Propionicicella superfundia]